MQPTHSEEQLHPRHTNYLNLYCRNTISDTKFIIESKAIIPKIRSFRKFCFRQKNLNSHDNMFYVWSTIRVCRCNLHAADSACQHLVRSGPLLRYGFGLSTPCPLGPALFCFLFAFHLPLSTLNVV